MNPDQLVFGFIQYVVFLLSTTCHEAAHALVAKMGGDLTAMQGGQVSLNPVPHIRREPFGMVVMPLLGIVSGGGLIGWASTPYNPAWSRAYPKRAAWMSLAGPATNFALAILAAILMRLGLAAGVFVRGDGMVGAASAGGVTEPVAAILSVFFSLNILLGCFNLLPVPPLDGYSVLGLFVSEDRGRALQDFRGKIGVFGFIALLLSWRYLGAVYWPVRDTLASIFGFS